MVWNHGAIIRELVCHLAEHGKISYGEWREKFGEYSDAMLDGQVSKSDTTTGKNVELPRCPHVSSINPEPECDVSTEIDGIFYCERANGVCD